MEILSNHSENEGNKTSISMMENVDGSDKMNEAGNSIDQDDALLQAQGHAAELERSFSWVGAVGLAFR
ncbi:uncharacterized protein TrAFT101_011425 [Trichoderma asperellum]|uniref:uncharacterized protein n=1 Tax=Trichoderma asperellum TaxID=101201 RepID=UPI00332DC956|nr:hypothetical protein TrAFT101_011425 [Trichoderma asperellum]